jgi:hypothetical protein
MLAIPTQGRRIHGPFACCIPKTLPAKSSFSLSKQKADNTGDNEVENRADHHAAHSTEQHEDVGLTKQQPTIRAPIKALRMQVTEKPRGKPNVTSRTHVCCRPLLASCER